MSSLPEPLHLCGFAHARALMELRIPGEREIRYLDCPYLLWFLAISESMIDCDELCRTTFLRRAAWFSELDSTNSYVARSASTRGQLPWLVGAERQIQGRGRGKNSWWSGSDSLTFSILINPRDWNIPTARWPLISLTTGAAICQALAGFVSDAALQLKWPNDVYLTGKKVCGILIESSPEVTERLIIGVGLNVNNDWSVAPNEIQRSATSLKVATGRVLSRMDILTAMLHELDVSLHELGSDPASIVRRCRACCWLTGHFVTVTELDRQVNGTCLGLDDDGALLVMTEHGPQRVLAGSVERHD